MTQVLDMIRRRLRRPAPYLCRALLLRGVVVTIVLIAAAVTIANDEDPDYERSGFYVGVSGSITSEQALLHGTDDDAEKGIDPFNDASTFSASVVAPVGLASESDPTWSVNGRVGYRVNAFVAGEIQVEYVESLEATANLLERSGALLARLRNENELITATLNGKLIVPLGRVQPYALGGFGIIHSDSEEDRFDFVDPDTGIELNVVTGGNDGVEAVFRGGGGVDLYATEHVVFNLEVTYVVPFGSFRDLDYLNAGLGIQYRF